MAFRQKKKSPGVRIDGLIHSLWFLRSLPETLEKFPKKSTSTVRERERTLGKNINFIMDGPGGCGGEKGGRLNALARTPLKKKKKKNKNLEKNLGLRLVRSSK